MRLSILIATLESRRVLFERLYKKLRGQILTGNYHGQVEIISSRDAGEATIGAKRNWLVRQAKGDFVCHIDDDDDCSYDYVPRLTQATLAGKDAVGFTGRVWWHNKWVRFVHSLRYKDYATQRDGTKTRPPNHLNPVRRPVALAHVFPEKDFGEDTDWAMSIARAGALKSEVFLGEPPVYYYRPAPGPKP